MKIPETLERDECGMVVAESLRFRDACRRR